MRAEILNAVKPAYQKEGNWKTIAIVDVRLDIEGIEIILRHVLLRAKGEKHFWAFKGIKKDDGWIPSIEFPSHLAQVKEALDSAWVTYNSLNAPPQIGL